MINTSKTVRNLLNVMSTSLNMMMKMPREGSWRK